MKLVFFVPGVRGKGRPRFYGDTVPTEHGYADITEESAEIIAAVTCEFKKGRPGL